MFSRLLCFWCYFWSYNPVNVVLKRKKSAICLKGKWVSVKHGILNKACAVLLKWDCCKRSVRMWNWTTNVKGCFFWGVGAILKWKAGLVEEFSLWFRRCLSLYLLCIRCKKIKPHLMNKRSECTCVGHLSFVSAATRIQGLDLRTSIMKGFSWVMQHYISVFGSWLGWPPHCPPKTLPSHPWRFLQGLISDCS